MFCDKRGLNTSPYKRLRPSQILFSENIVTNLKDEYTNRCYIDDAKFFSLSSGIPVSDGLASEILQIETVDNTLAYIPHREESPRDKVGFSFVRFFI